MTRQKQYFHLLNALRGIAAVLIVGRHTYAFGPVKFPVSYMAVDIFFLLSGVVIEANYRNRLANGMTPSSFIWMRLARIYPLYIFGSAITVLTIGFAPHHAYMLGSTQFQVPHMAFRWVLTMLCLPSPLSPPGIFVFNPPTWSLFYELLINALYGFIVLKLTKKRLALLIALAGIGLIGNLIYFHSANLVELGYGGIKTYFGGFCRAGFSFFLGVALYRINQLLDFDLIWRNSGIATVAIIGFTLALLMAPASKAEEVYFYVFSVFIAFPAIIFAALAVRTSQHVATIWDFLGDISYPVYTLHWPLFCFVSSIIAIEFDPGWFEQWPWTGIAFMVPLVVLSYVLDKSYDRAARAFLKKLRWPKRFRGAQAR